jgi:branched-chain amino acid transport system ATP-binding protein
VPLLKIEGISKSFGGLQAINNVSFNIGKGEILALIGPNGAGKTTLFNLIMGFFYPDTGKVIFTGDNIVGLTPHEICARGIARTFQIVKPFLTIPVFDNVVVGALNKKKKMRQAKKRAEEILDFVGLSDKKRTLASALTLPDRKRLELARALATDPKLLLLDEMMAGLTPAEIDRLIELFKVVNKQQITILLIEHVMRGVMALSQRIVVLNCGEKIAEGYPEEVMNNPKVLKAYLGEGFYDAQS